MPDQRQGRITTTELLDSITLDTSSIVLTPAEALIAISLLASAADDDLSKAERGTLSANHVRIFSVYPEQPSQEVFNKVFRLIEQHSSLVVFAAAKNALTPRLRQTAFAIAADLGLADGILTEGETDFLSQLLQALDIPQEIGKKIIDVIVIKNCV